MFLIPKVLHYQQMYSIRIIDYYRYCLLSTLLATCTFCYVISSKDGSTNVLSDFFTFREFGALVTELRVE